MKPLRNLLIAVGFCAIVAWAQTSPQEQVEKYFKALRLNKIEQALQVFGVKAPFSESQKAILHEYKVFDTSQVSQCEAHLVDLGKALATYNERQSSYPTSLSSLTPNYLKAIPTCPSDPKKAYLFERRDDFFYLLSCPSGHGRTPGFPKFSPIDGLISNPNLKLINYHKVLPAREENGLSKVKVIGLSFRGDFERDFLFTPNGGFVTGAFSKEVETILKTMVSSSVPRATSLDPASLVLGVALFQDQELIRAAHCRLLQEKLYYSILGVQTRLGEKSFDKAVKHLDQIPKCPTSKTPFQIKKLASGKTLIYCPGKAHESAGLAPENPRREF